MQVGVIAVPNFKEGLTMKNILLPVIILFLLSGAAFAQDSVEEVKPDIIGHMIGVMLFPDDNEIRAIDTVTLNTPPNGEFRFTLNKNLEIVMITVDGVVLEYETMPFEEEGFGEEEQASNFHWIYIDLPDGVTEFEITYMGEIFDPINPSTALGRARGDYTTGIISPDGIYLSSSSGWYPDTEYAMATYEVTVHLPLEWHAVTQGDLISRISMDDTNMSSWGSPIASDGCVLVANKYFITTREIAGINCSTYFYEDNPDLSAQFLDKLEEYVPVYVELLGPFPYNRFDVAENFFSTGYGMPAYTLLGSRVLLMPYATAEGSLAHELVHNWYGNYLYVDWEQGNWCEGLTVFCTNYYWNILSGKTDDEIADLRRRGMVRFSIEIDDETAYPIRQFRSKWTAADAAIGYDKASAFFLLLHDMVGKDKFFETLRLMLERYGGTKVVWADFETVFEEQTGRELDDFFAGWLDNSDAPILRLENVAQAETDDGYVTEFSVVQDGEPFLFPLSVHIKTEDGNDAIATISLFDREGIFRVQTLSPAVSIEVDPDYNVFRRLTFDQIQPCVNSTLDDDSILVILPSGGTDDMVQIMNYMGPNPGPRELSVKELYEEEADSIAGSLENVTIKYDADITEDDLINNSIICYGSPRINSIAMQLAGEAGSMINLDLDRFAVDDIEYNEEGYSALVSVRNPYNTDHNITFYFGNSPQAVFKAGYIFFYGWDSYVVYENGNAGNRGEWGIGPGPAYYEF